MMEHVMRGIYAGCEVIGFLLAIAAAGLVVASIISILTLFLRKDEDNEQ